MAATLAFVPPAPEAGTVQTTTPVARLVVPDLSNIQDIPPAIASQRNRDPGAALCTTHYAFRLFSGMGSGVPRELPKAAGFFLTGMLAGSRHL